MTIAKIATGMIEPNRTVYDMPMIKYKIDKIPIVAIYSNWLLFMCVSLRRSE